MSRLNELAERLDCLIQQHQTLAASHAQLLQELNVVSQERDALKRRWIDTRVHLDALLEWWTNPLPDAASGHARPGSAAGQSPADTP